MLSISIKYVIGIYLDITVDVDVVTELQHDEVSSIQVLKAASKVFDFLYICLIGIIVVL